MTEDEHRAALDGLSAVECRLSRVMLMPPESLLQRCAPMVDAEIDPTWLGELAEVVQDLPLSDANDGGGLGGALLAAAAPAGPWLLDEDPDAASLTVEEQRVEAARGLVQLAGQLDRVMAWAGAQQAAVLAALGRPGVAVPMGDLLDAVTQGGSGGPVGVASAEVLSAQISRPRRGSRFR